METKEFNEKMELPEGMSSSFENSELRIKGQKGEIARKIVTTDLKIAASGKTITLTAGRSNKKTKKMAGTIKAHVKNMINGLTKGYTYRMKICSGHFPMNIAVSGNELIIKNFFGEKSPRKVKINPGAKVKVEGQEIIIESADKEAAARCASAIEQITKRNNFDRRIFMDGIYITHKDTKELK